jgi:hypothetical protein
METQKPQDLLAKYWYGTPDVSTVGGIEHWFYGVFEGGGAKGIAYSGALLAMKEQRCWFSRVAGASTGAITAALVASGLSPEEIQKETDRGLEKVQTGRWAGLRRLQNATGYFSSDGLRAWLEELFATQVSRKTGTKPHDVTFRQLYDAAGIELDVVAADLSLKDQIIFSYIETPNCVVADAVVASSSIPFAFASRLLQVPEGDNTREQFYHHTVVDGGVWSNFPIFVFEDSAFRDRYHRDPKDVDRRKILGFLLKEEDGREPVSGKDVKFVEVSAGELRAKEWAKAVKAEVDEPSGLGSKVAAGIAWMLYPFSLLGRIVAWNSPLKERGRWPAPRSRLARNMVDSLNGLLGGIYPALFGLLAFAVVFIGAWEVINFLTADELKALRATDWTDPGIYFNSFVKVILTCLAVAVSVLVVFASLLGVAANFILLRASRRILYGLVTTYVSGPGAPEWATKRRNIIALRIPPKVTTLSFDMPAEERRDLIADARLTTLAKLEEILGKKHGPGLLDRS